MADSLDDVVDFLDPGASTDRWMTDRLAAIAATPAAILLRDPAVPASAPSVATGRTLGPMADAHWRKFVMAAFVADWACYDKPADRADFVRLMSVIALFGKGFRVWFAKLADGSYAPVGYTGWYPISATVFDIMCEAPGTIGHRGVMVPLRQAAAQDSAIYLFNYSIVPQLRKTAHSSAMMQAFAKDIAAIGATNLSAITVSDDGARVARRFGLEPTGTMIFEGEAETVYAKRRR